MRFHWVFITLIDFAIQLDLSLVADGRFPAWFVLRFCFPQNKQAAFNESGGSDLKPQLDHDNPGYSNSYGLSFIIAYHRFIHN